MESNRFETKVIHHGYEAAEHKGSLAAPLYQTSTFVFDSAEQGEARFGGMESGFIYSRLGNPTVNILEQKMALLEEGEAGLAFGSGMAAVSSVLISLTGAGDHILCSQGVYGCTFGLLNLLEEKYSITHGFSHMNNEETVRKGITPKTKVIYVETPINPTMQLIDLEMVSKVAKEYQIPVVVDNTFLSPYLQRPLTLGCDVVIHSATKYICGHGDVIAGIVVGKDEFIKKMALTTQKDIGGVMAPFDAWLLIRGLKTLPVRMERHCENALKIATSLKNHPSIKNVYYPGDPDHPQKEIVENQMKNGGGIISFELYGGKEEAQQFMNRLKLIKIAVSLGDAESLIQHPATMTHSPVPKEIREQMGISDSLLRLSVGLEHWEDVWDDLEAALNHK
ncbi:methionine gamma-lyase [Bacillus sp. RG28]|uniref:L-methionine gamma-lyase n=1 Tax=Gottfriedia endophytica TaxID=2820819 RepID=A0A940NKC2_9BACI|nr:methionine gamma-lyase [Gottfriedia endophytica]MBP0726040.1 methionine gamma-lyase [Gottfriedia endophytica]